MNNLNPAEMVLMRKAGQITRDALNYCETLIKPGISTKELDNLAKKFIIDSGAIPSFLGYEGYPASICTSVNEMVVHGIPSEEVILKEGDIISIDLGVSTRVIMVTQQELFQLAKFHLQSKDLSM